MGDKNELQMEERSKLNPDTAPDAEAGFERILDFIKPMGRWQIMIFCILFLLDMNLGMMNGAAVFILWIPKFTCNVSNITEPVYNNTGCQYTMESSETKSGFKNHTCESGYVYQTVVNDSIVMSRTVVTQWDLVCGDSTSMATSQTLYLVGFLLGSLICGPLSDKYGRRIVLLVSTLLMIALAVGQSYSPWFWLFLIFRMLYGATFISLSLIHYVVLQEITNSNWRAFMSGIFFAYAIGYALISAFAYGIKDWRHFHVAISSPLIPSLILMWFFVPESPRWLLANGKYEQANKVIQNAARINKSALPASIDLKAMGEALAKEKAANKQAEIGVLRSLMNVMNSPVMVLRLLDIGFCWIANNVVYYGLMLNVGDFVGGLLLNNAIYGLIEAPSYVFQVITSRFSRKWPLSSCLLLCGVALFVIPYIPEVVKTDPGTAQTVLCMFGKFFITASYGFVYLYTGELFPTNVRCGALGACSIIARIGAIVAPYIATIATNAPDLKEVPFIIYGIVSLLSGVTVIFLPETAGKPMPETMDDALAMRSRLGRLKFL